MAINTVMVIGAGQMGGGIAQVFASIGKKTYLNDIKQEFIDGGIAKITKNLDRSVSKGKITEEQKNETLKNIIPALDIDQVAGECDVRNAFWQPIPLLFRSRRLLRIRRERTRSSACTS